MIDVSLTNNCICIILHEGIFSTMTLWATIILLMALAFGVAITFFLIRITKMLTHMKQTIEKKECNSEESCVEKDFLDSNDNTSSSKKETQDTQMSPEAVNATTSAVKEEAVKDAADMETVFSDNAQDATDEKDNENDDKADCIETKVIDEIKNERVTNGRLHGWVVVGASVQGRNHVGRGVPCQDCHGFKSLDDGWWIAVTADGAGSALHSDKGSKFIVNSSLLLFSELIAQHQWKDKSLPSAEEWQSLASITIKKMVDGMSSWLKDNNSKTGNNNSLKDFGSTVIVVINSPDGMLVAHVGDGRAGYCNMNGEWKPIITPHKGTEANQTLFVTSPFWNIPFYRLSNVWVPECNIIKDEVKAVVLMSDGCEHSTWECLFFDEVSGTYYDPNKPFPGFFKPLISNLLISEQKNQDKGLYIYSMLKDGSEFSRETDDKTLLLMFCNNN